MASCAWGNGGCGMTGRHKTLICAFVVLAMVLRVSFATAASFQLGLPLACQPGKTCFVQNYVDHHDGDKARDYTCGPRTYAKHEGTDFRIPSMAAERAGVDVLAAADGLVLRTRDEVPDVSMRTIGASVIAGRECGNGLVIRHEDGWETQYCHMALGSLVVKQGQQVRRGDRLGHVGLSGNTEFAHLHLTVRHYGNLVDPFAPDLAMGVCGIGALPTLWLPEVAAGLSYRTRVVLNRGFAEAPMTMDDVESGRLEGILPSTSSPGLLAYVRAIGLEAGDVQSMMLYAPDGTILAQSQGKPLDGPKAQTIVYAGRKTPEKGWPNGRYEALYRVMRDGVINLEERFALDMKGAP